jgi:hypothetical protein
MTSTPASAHHCNALAAAAGDIGSLARSTGLLESGEGGLVNRKFAAYLPDIGCLR